MRKLVILVEEDKKRSVWGIKIVLVKAKTVLDTVKKTRKTLFMAIARWEKGQSQPEINSTETKGWRVLRDGVGAF